MLNKLQMQIKSLERHHGKNQRWGILGTNDLNQCSDDKLKAYLEYLRNGQEYQPNIEPEHTGGTEADIQDTEPSEIISTDIPEEPKTIAAAPAIQEPDSREKEIDQDLDEPSEIQSIAVAPAIEDHQCAWTLACCYLWLTSKNMTERKGVMFNTPRPFQELVNKNLWHEVPDQAEWTTWNRIHGCGLENFLASKESIEEYKQALKEIMCTTPHWWREKYLANSELLTK